MLPALFLRERSQVTVTRLHVSDFDETIVVMNQSNLTMENSELTDSKANLLFSTGGSEVTIRKCKFSNSRYPAISINGPDFPDAKVTVCKTTIMHSEEGGIALQRVSCFSITDCTFDDLGGSGIALNSQSVGEILNNRITHVKGNGIFVSRSEAEIRGNTIQDCQYPGFAFLEGSAVTVRSNTIRTVRLSGIAIRASKGVRLEKTTVDGAGECGISISDTEQCTIKDCSFMRCKIAGLECYNRSKVTITQSLIDEAQFGFLVYTLGRLDASHNRANRIEKALARLVYRGQATVTETRCRAVAVRAELETGEPYLFHKNGRFPGQTNDPSAISNGILLVPKFENPFGSQCINCRAKDRDTFFVKCGHRVYCRDCATEWMEAGQKCPLCRFPIDGLSAGYDVSASNLCTVCLENRPNSLIMPCGHIGFCHLCLGIWFKEHNRCPMCGVENSSFKEIVYDI
jgi:hypothetical protein